MIFRRKSSYDRYGDESSSSSGGSSIPKFTITKNKIILVFISILVFFFILSLSQIVGTNKAGFIQVKQAAISGEMEAIFKEGMFARWFAYLEPYPTSDTYYFSKHTDEGKATDESVPVTFRNGSTGFVSGSVRYAYPQNQDDMIGLHRRFRSDRAVYLDLVRTEVRKLISMTAMLLTPEAAMTQKGIFYQYLADQIINGQYQTVASVEEYEDPITKEKKTRDVVDIALDAGKNKLRMPNPFDTWRVKLDQLVVSDIAPDGKTLEMIAKRRDAEMNIMVAKADAEKARKETEKVIAEGQKAVSEKEYAALQTAKTETVNAEKDKQVAEIKAKREKEVAIIDAQKQVDVNRKRLEAAELDKQTATAEKAAAIARGEGEAKARELIMLADGGLNKKLETFERVMKDGFNAMAARKVPEIVMGGGAGGAANVDNAGLEYMNLINVWAAKQLALDMNMSGGHQPKK